MTTHTPGPWAVIDRQDAAGEHILCIETDDTMIASLSFSDDYGPTPEGSANARLIAAAPDLLNACRLALDAILKHIPPTEFAPRIALRDAIAKAEG